MNPSRHLFLALLLPLVAPWLALGAAGTSLPALRVSDNHRFLVQADGRPFFWLGDTAWELLHRLDREEARAYLRQRAAQGYTVIQTVVLAELDGLNVPNAAGALPLVDRDPLRPNEAYFAHVDWVVAEAQSHGLYVALLPTWGDKWNKGSWGAGPEIFTPENAEHFAAWLARRYAGSNVIWVLGGDRHIENDAQRAVIEAMARGLRTGPTRQLITFHPCGGMSSADYFHDAPWLDFNMRQNGHEINYGERYAGTRRDYDRQPVKPVIDAEPVYEDHPIDFKAAQFGYSTAAEVRRPLYWDLFNGAFGHTYGHHSVWQMYGSGRTPVNGPLLPWQEAVNQPGAAQMQFARRLLESRPFLTRVPADDVLIADDIATAVPGAGRYRFSATKDSEGSYAMIYVPVERRFRVNLGVIRGGSIRAWWYDPRTGAATAAGEYRGSGPHEFTPPAAGQGLDWVLVLDDTSRNFAAPGTPLP